MTDFAAAPPKMVPCLLNGRWELLLPEHRAARTEWTTPPYWEPERLTHMRANIYPGDVVYDIGAEEGDMAGLFQTWAGPTGKLVLVEPNPRVWPNIRAIWQANQLPHPLATWVGFASDSTVEHPEAMDTNARRLMSDGWPKCAHGPVIGDHGFLNVWERPHDTPQITIDELAFRTTAPDVITMDIEGAELLALRGAEQTLREHRPLVYVSVHPDDFMAPYGYNQNDLWEFMFDCGYNTHFIADDHETHILLANPEGRKVIHP